MIELPKQNRQEEIGFIAASSLHDFFLQKIGPCLYNKAVADVQHRLQGHITDLDADFHEIECPFWLPPDRMGRCRPAAADAG